MPDSQNIYSAPVSAVILDLIAWSEGTSTNPATKNYGYDVIVIGEDRVKEIFTDYSDHPFSHRPPKLIRQVPLLRSTAAGRYQILWHIYESYKAKLLLPNFSPHSQDLIALKMIYEAVGGHISILQLKNSGTFREFIYAISHLWASLPGNKYGQSAHAFDVVLDKWNSLLNRPAAESELNKA